MAAFRASARSLDRGVGAVLDALDVLGLADDTLVICTTDHGIAFPGAKATLTDRGIGVMLILRGPGGFVGRQGNRRARLAHRHLPDRLRFPGSPGPTGCRARRCCRWCAARRDEVRDAIFAEGTYTPPTSRSGPSARRRWKLIRRFGERALPVSRTQTTAQQGCLVRDGWRRRLVAPDSYTTSCSTRTRRAT